LINNDSIFSIRECAADLIRDISDVSFDELVKYKIYENTTTEQNTPVRSAPSKFIEKKSDLILV
jgi:hypothetical protein